MRLGELPKSKTLLGWSGTMENLGASGKPAEN